MPVCPNEPREADRGPIRPVAGIEENDIDLLARLERDSRVGECPGAPDHLDPGRLAERGTQAIRHHGMVVHDGHADHDGRSQSNLTATPSDTLVTVVWAATASARSPIESSPK